ncbi:hypothetical protein [Pseudomonas paracarnis]|uniref:hypothetical protein n=1 Tax=Pseudomonas paracarnis TaxID=2750625 RepID=UPI00191BCA69|nr:hypothetical protein [Pseudomonas paracarnis]
MTRRRKKNTLLPTPQRQSQSEELTAIQHPKEKNKIESSQEKYTLYVALFALILSVVSTIASWKTYKISATQSLQEKLLVLKGVFDKNDNTHIAVKTISEKNFFLEGEAFFPSSIIKSPSPIEADGQILYMGDMLLTLENMLLEKHKPLDGNIQFTRINIPVVIKSRYVTKGLQYTDFSLYFLKATALIKPLPETNVKITFISLSFVGRMNPEDDPQNYIDQLYEAGGITINPPTPTT